MNKTTSVVIFDVPADTFQTLGDIYPSGGYHLEDGHPRVFRLPIELADIYITYFEGDKHAEAI